MDTDDQQVQQTLSQLINKGRDFKAAFRYGERYLRNTQDLDRVSAHVWFQVALAARLTNADPSFFQEGARKASDYTLIMEGDFLRDKVLQEIRRGHTLTAEMLMPAILALHSGDENREAVLSMVRGRLEYAKGYLDSASRLYRDADKAWEKLGEKANQQWIANNLFAWLSCLIRLEDLAQEEVYNHFIAIEKSKGRKRTARILMFFGRPAVFAYDWLRRIKS